MDGYQLNTLTEYAAYKLFEIESNNASQSDRDNLLNDGLFHRAKYEELKRRQGMNVKSMTMKLPTI